MKKKNSGQVLFLGIIMLLIMLFAIFMFFDLHNIIRGKVKLETAEQSAALTACRWQAKSLNLVGELNLLIAAESVLQDNNITVPSDAELGVEGESEEKKQYACGAARIRSINEMQSRITFIGPLIALASTQSAAKNNGITTVHKTENSDSPQNVADDFDEYIKRLREDNNIYYAADALNINGYAWKKPYIAMLEDIINSGIAVRPNATIIGIEGIKPSYLADAGLYNAILACNRGYPSWCHWNLRNLVKMNDSYFEGLQWYTPDFKDIRFSQQSEVYPLDIRLEETLNKDKAWDAQLNSLYSDNYEKFERQANDIRTTDPVMNYDRIMNYSPSFYHYNDRWLRDSEIYTGPIVDTSDTPWKRGEYLNRDVADWAVYGGAVAYSECVENIPEVLPFKSKLSQAEAKRVAAGKRKVGSEIIRKNYNSSIRVGGNYTLDKLNTGCVAKPLGKLSGDLNPTKIPVVLPVFSRVNLIPSLMQEIRIFSFEWPLVEKFILGLHKMIEDGKNIYDDVEMPAGTEYMLEAIRLLGQKEFRRTGYNPEYKERQEVATNEVVIKYLKQENHTYHPQNNPQGPGWLQQPVVRSCRKGAFPDEVFENSLYYYTREDGEKLNEIRKIKKQPLLTLPPENEVWACYRGKYLKIRNGILQDIMEDDPDRGCGKKTGSSSGRMPAGSNMSPERL